MSRYVMDLVGNDLTVKGDEGYLWSPGAEVHAETEFGIYVHYAGMDVCLSIMSAIKNLIMASDSSLGPPATPP